MTNKELAWAVKWTLGKTYDVSVHYQGQLEVDQRQGELVQNVYATHLALFKKASYGVNQGAPCEVATVSVSEVKPNLISVARITPKHIKSLGVDLHNVANLGQDTDMLIRIASKYAKTPIAERQRITKNKHYSAVVSSKYPHYQEFHENDYWKPISLK